MLFFVWFGFVWFGMILCWQKFWSCFFLYVKANGKPKCTSKWNAQIFQNGVTAYSAFLYMCTIFFALFIYVRCWPVVVFARSLFCSKFFLLCMLLFRINCEIRCTGNNNVLTTKKNCAHAQKHHSYIFGDLDRCTTVHYSQLVV